ncbi:type II toxin-antitoxin system RelE/ParE family toxin [Candidatus Poribacteria bacterium]|nr:type II toxin-antitoxin system RelE/ParE family toxin [Candidatus Poribacteria bacterium]
MRREYRILPTHHFQCDFDRLDAQIQHCVLEAIEQMRENPLEGLFLRNKEIGRRKWRVGDYRIRYDTSGDDVILYFVKHRREIYRDRTYAVETSRRICES